MSLRILIVDDHRVAREAIRIALQFCRPGLPEIVGEAADGATALEMARRLTPDVITMDIGLPDIKGLEVTRRLKAELPQVRVIVVTVHEERVYREEAIRVGAVAYITKERLLQELPGCLEQLAGQRSVRGAEH